MLYEPRKDQEDGLSLSEADVEALRRLLRLVEQARGSEVDVPSAIIGSFDLGLVQVARLMLRARRRRARHFNPAMLGEPGWDMLLVLYANGDDGARLSVGRLSELAGAAPSTAIRWLEYLVGEQLLYRRPNPLDARTDFIELTEKGRTAMEQYLSETLESLR